MRIFLLFILVTSVSAAHAFPSGNTLGDIRDAYVEAIDKASAAKAFNQRMQKLTSPGPLKLGYKGAAQTLRAKHSWNPYKKTQYLQKGMDLLNDAIARKPADIELRFLRLSVAYYLPGFLGYDEYVEKDRDEIVRILLEEGKPDKPEDVLNVVLDFLLSNELCTEKEQEALMQLKS
jgi:hypothetical protein